MFMKIPDLQQTENFSYLRILGYCKLKLLHTINNKKIIPVRISKS